jgi:rhodanese-related sulfurtransferase
MPTEISREEVIRMRASGAQLIEVMPEKEYEEEHLPAAINIPLKKLDSKADVVLDRDEALIVYCNDYQ